jgi:hypothetical protein
VRSAEVALALLSAAVATAWYLAVPPPARAAATGNASTCAPLAVEPTLTTPQTGDIYLRGGTATCTTIEVEVAARNLDGLFTAGFDLRFPAALLKYEGYTGGPILAKGSPKTRPFFLVQNPATGTLQVTMTRFSPDGDVAVQGRDTLLVLLFSRVAPGQGAIDFDQAADSPIVERIVNAAGVAVSARFGPGHGAAVSVP